MKRNFNKAISVISVLYFVGLAALVLIPALSVKADTFVTLPIGGTCPSTVTQGLTCGDVTVGTGTVVAGTLCDANSKCVPVVADRKIGTWCSHAAHCDQKTGSLTLTCDTGKEICVGATVSVACSDQLVVHNAIDEIGWLITDTVPSDRCATGLFCDAGAGTCQQDTGSGFIPTEKLGDTATDIRDQIRNLINIALGFLGVAGVIITIYGGSMWMTAAGDDEKVEKGKKTIIAGAIGLIIIGIAWTIVSWVLSVSQDIA